MLKYKILKIIDYTNNKYETKAANRWLKFTLIMSETLNPFNRLKKVIILSLMNGSLYYLLNRFVQKC